MNIGILTGGGDCPGLNPVIRAAVRTALKLGHDVIGIRNGWKGLLERDLFLLTREHVNGILHRGGTILGTSRTNPYKVKDGEQTVLATLTEFAIDVLLPIGGEDTLGVAARLSKAGVKCIGVPKTIDNDLPGTDFTFGFDTAVNVAMEAIDRLHTTAESHHRVLVCEVMGRHTGWIALYAGVAGGADVILMPEKPIDIDMVCDKIRRRHATGKTFSIVVVAEGTKVATEEGSDADGSFVLSSMKKDSFGHVRLGGIGNVLAEEIERRLGFETRSTVLGHIQRGGSPTAYDRFLGTRYGIAAVKLIQKQKYGRMVALAGNTIIDIDIEQVLGQVKSPEPELLELADAFDE